MGEPDGDPCGYRADTGNLCFQLADSGRTVAAQQDYALLRPPLDLW
jgi:hypothetical protein